MGRYIFGALLIGALIFISILAMDALNGGQIMMWLDQHTGPPNTNPRF